MLWYAMVCFGMLFQGPKKHNSKNTQFLYPSNITICLCNMFTQKYILPQKSVVALLLCFPPQNHLMNSDSQEQVTDHVSQRKHAHAWNPMWVA